MKLYYPLKNLDRLFLIYKKFKQFESRNVLIEYTSIYLLSTIKVLTLTIKFKLGSIQFVLNPYQLNYYTFTSFSKLGSIKFELNPQFYVDIFIKVLVVGQYCLN